MRTAGERKQKSSEVEEKEITKCILNFKVTSPETIYKQNLLSQQVDFKHTLTLVNMLLQQKRTFFDFASQRNSINQHFFNTYTSTFLLLSRP